MPKKRKGKAKAEVAKVDPNFLYEAGPGCHIAHYEAQWTLGTQTLSEAGVSDDEVDSLPDIAIDPVDLLLSVFNPTQTPRTCVMLRCMHQSMTFDHVLM